MRKKTKKLDPDAMLGKNGNPPELQLQKSVASLGSMEDEDFDEPEEKPKKKIVKKVVKKVVKKKAPEPEEDLLGDFGSPQPEPEPEPMEDDFDEPEPRGEWDWSPVGW